MNRTVLLSAAAGMVLALGLVLLARSLAAGPEAVRQLERRGVDLAQLRELERAESRARSAVETFNQLPSKSPVSLNELAAQVLPGVQTSFRRKEDRPLIDGWTLRVVEVTFEDVGLEGVDPFLSKAGATGSRPPWRLAECNITASDQPGRGRVTVLLEGLEKADANR